MNSLVCKSCIFKHVSNVEACPICNIELGPNPLELIKVDRQKQSIVDKIFPHLMIQEMERERSFWKSHGIFILEHEDRKRSAPPLENTTPLKKPKKNENPASKKGYSDEVGFELTLDEKSLIRKKNYFQKFLSNSFSISK